MLHKERILELGARLHAEELTEGVQTEYALAPLSTYRVGGAAALFVRPVNEDELLRTAEATANTEVDILLLGRGSNILVSDNGFTGLVIQLGSGFEGIHIKGVEVAIGGAADMPVVARRSVAAGLRGFEWAVGVPGSIGGAVRMNAGGHGSDMATVLTRATVLNLRTAERSYRNPSDLQLGYRSSSVASTEVITEVGISLRVGGKEEGERLLTEVVRWRRENQPGGQNAGSVFINPVGDSAGRLIDLVGARGLRVGTAQVSPKHANFIQADTGGLAADVVRVMREVQERVAETFGVNLIRETILVGFDD